MTQTTMMAATAMPMPMPALAPVVVRLVRGMAFAEERSRERRSDDVGIDDMVGVVYECGFRPAKAGLIPR